MAELIAEDVEVSEVVKWNNANFTVDSKSNIREPDVTWLGINATGPLGEHMTFRPSEIQVRCREAECNQWSEVGTDRCDDH